MSFYKSIGSPFAELKIEDFELPQSLLGSLPECYMHYGENCHLKYFGKDYYFKVRIPELEKVVSPGVADLEPYKRGTLSLYFSYSQTLERMTKETGGPNNYCDKCVFLNPRREKTGIRCLLRRGNSRNRKSRCVFMHEAYFEPLDLSKDSQ